MAKKQVALTILSAYQVERKNKPAEYAKLLNTDSASFAFLGRGRARSYPKKRAPVFQAPFG